ncbi:DUF72 domain-containing protein [Pseudomonas sp. G.S.17]|uniref:DUF72 domain-containing protein n=1 Tax=Pseudomonas sp. G.S.17 TaxID=3137451 RepID=UPI00311C9F20
MSDIRIGISGWRYVPWRGDFYPEELTQKNELKFASRAVNSIEINGSFYSLKTPKLYAGWFAEVPDDFVYLRLHGDEKLYASGYTAKALKRWGDRIQEWREGSQPADAHLIVAKAVPKRKSRDIFCYFDNDIKVRAPYDARQLLERFDLTQGLEVAPGDMQGVKF